MTDENRRQELVKKSQESSLTGTEFQELLALSPPGSQIALPPLETAGLLNASQSFANILSARHQSQRAYDAGFFIEVLALRSQTAELFLRVYLAAKQGQSSFPPQDKRPLGALIGDAEAAGFDTTVIGRLRQFNDDRINGIHKFLLGAAPYEDIKGACDRSADLTDAVTTVIGAEFGQPLN